MSMQAPAGDEELANYRTRETEDKVRWTIGVVSPEGVVSQHYVPPPPKGMQDGLQQGDTICRWVNGEAQVSKRWKDKGWQLLEEVAKADGQEDCYANWRKAVAVILRGGEVAGDVGELYPRTVHELRAKAASGNTSGQVFVVGHGVVSGPAAKKERVAALLESMGAGNPLHDEEPPALEPSEHAPRHRRSRP